MTVMYLAAARTGVRDRLLPTALFVLAVAFTAAVTLGLLRVVDQPSYGIALAVPMLVVLVIALFAIPVHTIPAVVIAVLALFPTRLIPSTGPFNALPPLALVMAVWVLRRVLLAHQAPRTSILPPLSRIGPRVAVYAFAVILVGWLATSTLSTGRGETQVGWTTAFVASVILPLLVLDARREAEVLRKVIVIVGAITGTIVFAEMMLGVSPLYGLVGEAREFEFSVYRAQGAFSHPLFAGAFLTVPAMIGIGTWLTTGRKWMLVCGALAAAGVVATVSRGSIGAIGAAAAVAAVVAPLFLGWRGIGRWLAFLAFCGVGTVMVLNFGPLVQRASSIESQLSASVRDRAITVALDAGAYSGWYGTGPGTSGQTGRLFDTIVIENSLLQLLISVGLPGLVIFLLFVAGLVWCAWARGDLAVGLAIIAYIVAISGFNTLDAVRSMHVIIGILALLAVHDSTPLPPAGQRRDPPALSPQLSTSA